MTDKQVDQDEFDPDYKSKTQLKEESAAIQKLGAQLVELPQAAFDSIPLNEGVIEAIEIARRINRKKDGFRRQLQFIGKLLRSEDLEPIEFALAKFENAHHEANKAFHRLETQRDELLHRGDEAIQELMDEFPHLDRQMLRQLIRNAKKQAQSNKPPKASRELFQYLKHNTQ